MICADLTTWTVDGPVDIVALDRFLRGADIRLTDAERRVAIHVLTAAGHGPSAIAGRLHEHQRTVEKTLTRPAPVDRRGRPFHLTA